MFSDDATCCVTECSTGGMPRWRTSRGCWPPTQARVITPRFEPSTIQRIAPTACSRILKQLSACEFTSLFLLKGCWWVISNV